YSRRRGKLAMLCKNSVIKNLVEFLPQTNYKVSDTFALGIDARRDFEVSVDASLCIMSLGSTRRSFFCKVGALEKPSETYHSFGWASKRFVSNREAYKTIKQLDGACPFTWRQGLKHDCATIMELSIHDGQNRNGKGET